MTTGCMLGLDVGKQWLDMVAGSTGTPQRFANEPAGHQELVAWATTHQPQLVVLEASGGYERAIVTALDGAGIAVSVQRLARISPTQWSGQ